MEGDLSGEEMIWHFGELAAIATVADIVELTGENRLIVQRGLECISLGEQIGVKALIEAAGLKGLTIGGAQVSEKHAGFIVNRGGATASDILSLIKHVQARVKAQTGVTLETEIRLIG